METIDEKQARLKEYYGRVLKGSSDLKTSACCTPEDAFPVYLRPIIGQIHDEILDKFYGCGSPIPDELNGRMVLDLGCGTGRDVYLLSKLVGESGLVIGVDMTKEQIDVAKKYADHQMKVFNFQKSNVDFRQGYIEDLKSLGIEDNSIDVVISNCVINLSPDKQSVFSEIFRVLKPGGELYFSDVFSDRRIPKELMDDPVLHGECLSGALYIEDFRRLMRDLGCLDYRVVTSHPIQLDDNDVHKKIGMAEFSSKTIRAFKLSNLEDICEDYGQVAIYQGTIDHHPHYFDLDDHHRFHKGKPLLVCGNTASMLHETRFTKHFKILGDRSMHYGAFDCVSPTTQGSLDISGSCC